MHAQARGRYDPSKFERAVGVKSIFVQIDWAGAAWSMQKNVKDKQSTSVVILTNRVL